MAVLTRAREQQAAESGERVMPSEPQEMTCKQRSRYNKSGIDAKRAMNLAQQEPKVEGPRQVRVQKTTFKNPTDFYAGPAEAGRVLGGPRRFDGMNTDSVGYMMSDDFHSSTEEQPRTKPVGGPQHVDNRCLPLHEEPAARLLVKPIHGREGLDAPFAEHYNPKPLRDHEKPRSVKLFPEKTSCATAITFAAPPPRVQPSRGNPSNDSKLMNDYFHGKDEKPNGPRRPIGPVEWQAPEMDYPKRRPAIRPINSSCAQCHDVLSAGRFGNLNEFKRRGLGPVDTPYKDQSTLIGFVEQAKPEARPVKPNTIIRYFDPALDNPSHFSNNQRATGRSHPPGKTINSVSEDCYVPPRGKGKGAYGQGNSREFVIG